jgi:medium-chain acyl-[acyl-carrier-protein] hydrolase
MPSFFYNLAQPTAEIGLRLFCFPYAGGSATIYRAWQQHAPAWLQICPVEIPGRGRLSAEPLPSSIVSLAEDLSSALYPLANIPFALFGHSMGAAIAYEVASRLENVGRRQLRKLFVSGARAPYLPPKRTPVSHLPDEDFMDRLRNLNGTPTEVLENRELMEVMMPLLRADFAMCERYRLQRPSILRTSITALYGDKDEDVLEQDVNAWRRLTSNAFHSLEFPGDHFFINENEIAVVDVIAEELRQYMLQAETNPQ